MKSFLLSALALLLVVLTVCGQTQTSLSPGESTPTRQRDFFSTFESKDWVTFFASGIAVLFSTITLLQKLSESKTALRKNLTDVLEKLTNLNTEAAKYEASTDDEKQKLPTHYVRFVNDQRRFLVRQAAAISERIPRLVFGFEYVLIASSFDASDYADEAAHHLDLAISKSTGLDKGVALRRYALLLMKEQKFEAARDRFQLALEQFSGSSPAMHHYRGDTFERWANTELHLGAPKERVLELLRNALAEFEAFRATKDMVRVAERIKDVVGESSS